MSCSEGPTCIRAGFSGDESAKLTVEVGPEVLLTEGEMHAAARPPMAGRPLEAAGLQPPDMFFIGEAGCTDLEDLFSFDMELMLAYGPTAAAVLPEVEYCTRCP